MGCQQRRKLLDTDRSVGGFVFEVDFALGTHLADVAVRPSDLHSACHAVVAVNIVEGSVASCAKACTFVEVGKLCRLYCHHKSPFEIKLWQAWL